MKLQFLTMITDAILNLQERSGSSREAIWKYLLMKYPESVSDKKVFLVQLKRIAAAGTQVEKNEKNKARYRLNKLFKNRYLKKLESGEEMHLAQKHAMTTKTKSNKKAASKMSKAKQSKTAKGKKSLMKKKEKASKMKNTKKTGTSKTSKPKSKSDKKMKEVAKGKKGSVKNQ